MQLYYDPDDCLGSNRYKNAGHCKILLIVCSTIHHGCSVYNGMIKPKLDAFERFQNKKSSYVSCSTCILVLEIMYLQQFYVTMVLVGDFHKRFKLKT